MEINSIILFKLIYYIYIEESCGGHNMLVFFYQKLTSKNIYDFQFSWPFGNSLNREAVFPSIKHKSFFDFVLCDFFFTFPSRFLSQLPEQPKEKGPIPPEHQVLQDIFEDLRRQCQQRATNPVIRILTIWCYIKTVFISHKI